MAMLGIKDIFDHQSSHSNNIKGNRLVSCFNSCPLYISFSPQFTQLCHFNHVRCVQRQSS